MLRTEKPDFVEVITNVETHARFVKLAAELQIPVICQKPMAPSLAEAAEMIRVCKDAGVPFFIHENFRFQTPVMALKSVLDAGTIGTPFRARLDFNSSFPVFDNQPALRDLEQFILADVGTHILDLGRFFFGEMESVYCRTHSSRLDIRGEDVATVVLSTRAAGMPVVCNMSYASRIENESFPETLAFVEGNLGSAELAPDYSLRVTTAAGTHVSRVPPASYPWVDPRYAVVHSSIVDCNRDMLAALQTGKLPRTHAADNLRTLQLVFAAYQSAGENRVINIQP